jgi:predicted ABC-class ATPase
MCHEFHDSGQQDGQTSRHRKTNYAICVRVVRSIYMSRGVSTVLVIGGAGDYFDVADHVLLMDCYKCEDATERANRLSPMRQVVRIAASAEVVPLERSDNDIPR